MDRSDRHLLSTTSCFLIGNGGSEKMNMVTHYEMIRRKEKGKNCMQILAEKTNISTTMSTLSTMEQSTVGIGKEGHDLTAGVIDGKSMK